MKRLPCPHPAATIPHRPAISAQKTTLTARAFATLALITALSLALVTLGGCKKSAPEPTQAGTDEPKPVLFKSSIGDMVSTSINTRTSQANNTLALSSSTRTAATGDVSSAWVEGDAIGVFMIPHGGALTDDATVRNALYTHTEDGFFEARDGGGVVYPRIGSVDFVAYYPWRATFGSHTLAIDVGGACDPTTMDFLYSDNAADCSSGDVPTLLFHHRLAKLVFNVIDATGASLSKLGATINGPATRATFDLAAGQLAVDDGSPDEIEAAWRDDGDATNSTARLEAIVVPSAAAVTTVDFAPGDGSTARLTLAASEWLAGSVHTYRVRITEGGDVVFAGDTEIVDWDEQNGDSSEHNIEKQRPGGNDQNGNDDDSDDEEDPEDEDNSGDENEDNDPNDGDDPDDGDPSNPDDGDDGDPSNPDDGEDPDDEDDPDDGDDNPDDEKDPDDGNEDDDPSNPDEDEDPSNSDDEDDPSTPTDPAEPVEPDKEGVYFTEGFGNHTGPEDVPIADYTGWENAAASFSDRYGGNSGGGTGSAVSANGGDGARVSYSETLGTHILFPPGANADFKIDKLPANRSEIILSYDIASLKAGVTANTIKVYAGGTNLTKFVTSTIHSPNEYVRITIAIPAGTAVTSLRFVTERATNTGGMRLDNIRLERKPTSTTTAN